jgi:hypothetical protein
MTTETESSNKTATGNAVEGFSDRFTYLIDRARWPKEGRLSVGGRRFNVAPNTFKSWMINDRIPGTHSALVEMVGEILKDIPGRYNPKAVVAWLLAGDAVPNPFGDDNNDALQLVDVYLQVVSIAQNEGVDFNLLPKEIRNVILKHVHAMTQTSDDQEGVKFDNATLSLIAGMLETARVRT